MILFSLALFFAQLLVLNCKETLVNGDKSSLLPKLRSVQNGGKKVIELKILDKKDCETICEKHWLKTFCKLKTQCSAVSKCKKENCLLWHIWILTHPIMSRAEDSYGVETACGGEIAIIGSGSFAG